MRGTHAIGLAVLIASLGLAGCGSVNGVAPAQSGPVTVAIDTAPATMSIGASHRLTATVTGATSGVTWSIAEGAAGGSITADGLYTAPGVPGTYHVIATSQADPLKSATVAIVVQAGSGAVIVR